MNKIISKESLSDQVYKHIKRMILSGELKGGERVPEAALSELFGVSRTPLREALKRLSDYGLVFLKPRSYAEVVEISDTEARQIAQVRLHLEKLAAQCFSEHAEEEDYRALKQIAEECEHLTETGDLAGSYEYDSRWHLELAKRSGNKYLYEILEKLDARIQLLRLNQKLEAEPLQHYTKQHTVLIEAIRNRDTKIVNSMLTSHIMHDVKQA